MSLLSKNKKGLIKLSIAFILGFFTAYFLMNYQHLVFQKVFSSSKKVKDNPSALNQVNTAFGQNEKTTSVTPTNTITPNTTPNLKIPNSKDFTKKCIGSPNNDEYDKSVTVCIYFYKPFKFEYYAVGLDNLIDGEDKYGNYFQINRYDTLTDNDIKKDVEGLKAKGFTILEQKQDHAQYFKDATYFVKAKKDFNGAPTKTYWIMYYKNSIHGYGWKFTLSDDTHNYTDSIVETTFRTFQVKPDKL